MLSTGGASEVLAFAFAGATAQARQHAASLLAVPGIDDSNRASVLAASVLADYFDARYVDALLVARRAVELAESGCSGEARLLAAVVHALALANATDVEGTLGDATFDVAFAQREVFAGFPQPLRDFTSALLIEAAFANGRIALAAEILAERSVRAPDAFAAFPMLNLQPVRVHIFSGDTVAARAHCEMVLASCAEHDHTARALAHGFLALVAGYQGNAEETQQHADAVRTLAPRPSTMRDGGAHTVSAYGLAALERYAEARAMVLSGGGGPDLHLSQLVDRAIGYDILVTAALAEGDMDAAVLWARRAKPFAIRVAANHVIDQMEARIAFALGDAERSANHSAKASSGARSIGRNLEATSADLSHARALIAAGRPGAAVSPLNVLAHDADRGGSEVLRKRAAVELRRLGRRVEPRHGAGAAALSDREIEVANLAAEGFTNRHIAQSLFLSERTIQIHLGRAMRALGVSHRSALPGALGGLATIADAESLPLTDRQREVSEYIHAGLTNAEISARMGIGVKTVEKHVASIFERWSVTSRTAISRRVASSFQETSSTQT